MSDGHNQHGRPKVSAFAVMYGLCGTEGKRETVLRVAEGQLSSMSFLRLRRRLGLQVGGRGRPLKFMARGRGK